MGTYKSVLQIRRSVNLRGTKTTVTATFWGWDLCFKWKGLSYFNFSYVSFDAIEKRKIVAENFLLFKRSVASTPLKKCYGFFSESLFGLKNIKNLGAVFFTH